MKLWFIRQVYTQFSLFTTKVLFMTNKYTIIQLVKIHTIFTVNNGLKRLTKFNCARRVYCLEVAWRYR